MKLYTYFRSSAAYRVRIALQLKGLEHSHVPVHLLRNGGEQHSADYAALNPTQLVPTLVDGDVVLGQSMAIMEYLEEAYPTPSLLPKDLHQRAWVRSLMQSIACDIHPLNNLRVLQYLEQPLGLDEAARTAWYRHWVALGFNALEAMLTQSPYTGRYCHGDTPTLADCCLIPQVTNARRYALSMAPYPTITRIDAACRTLPAFEQAAPENQADAV
jgi:maleylpyruvate isomerase